MTELYITSSDITNMVFLPAAEAIPLEVCGMCWIGNWGGTGPGSDCGSSFGTIRGHTTFSVISQCSIVVFLCVLLA